MGPPSVRDGRAYEVTCYNPPCDIPATLVAWLLEGQTEKRPKNPADVRRVLAEKVVNVDHLYEYDPTDDQLWAILNKLPNSYLTDYNKWLNVTAVLKHHGKHDIWAD